MPTNFAFLTSLLVLAVVWQQSPGQEFESAGRRTLLNWVGNTDEGGPPGFDEPLASDRPDFVEASVTVGRGVRQLEMGYTYFRDEATGLAVHSYPEFLFRVGMFADWLEFRIGQNFHTRHEGTGAAINRVSGAEDLYLGVKFGLTPQLGILPEMCLVPQMTVPTGKPDLTAGEVLPGFNWLYGWDLNDWLGLGASTQMNVSVDDLDANYVEFAQAFTLNYELTQRLGTYTEWFMLTPIGGNSVPTEQYADGGFTYKVTNDLQLDIRAGKGLSAGSADYFVGSGAVVRW
jgi:hypothetical protein